MNYLGSTCTNLPTEDDEVKIDFEKMSKLELEPIVQSLWEDHIEVAKIITDSFQKWIESSRRRENGRTHE